MNVGFVEALKEYDYECFVFSDVDLVPMDDRNFYRCFPNPRHLAVGMDKFNFGLPYKTFFGGVSSLSKDQFLAINGFPNTYWGWGGEDDDVYKRIVFHGMTISRPDMMVGKYKMIKHTRDLHNEQNPENPDKLIHTQQTMDKDGIKSLSYKMKKIIKDPLYTLVNVDINAPSNWMTWMWIREWCCLLLLTQSQDFRLMNSDLLNCARCVGFTFGVRSCMETGKCVPVQIKLKVCVSLYGKGGDSGQLFGHNPEIK